MRSQRPHHLFGTLSILYNPQILELDNNQYLDMFRNRQIPEDLEKRMTSLVKSWKGPIGPWPVHSDEIILSYRDSVKHFIKNPKEEFLYVLAPDSECYKCNISRCRNPTDIIYQIALVADFWAIDNLKSFELEFNQPTSMKQLIPIAEKYWGSIKV